MELDWLLGQLEGKYELRKGGRLGPGVHDAKEPAVLNCVLRCIPRGLQHEADPRQVEKLLEGLKPLLEQLEKDVALPIGSHTQNSEVLLRGPTTYRRIGSICSFRRRRSAVL